MKALGIDSCELYYFCISRQKLRVYQVFHKFHNNNFKLFVLGRNIGYEVYKDIMGEELFNQKIEEFEKVGANEFQNWSQCIFVQNIFFLAEKAKIEMEENTFEKEVIVFMGQVWCNMNNISNEPLKLK